MGKERLNSFMKEVPTIQKPDIDLQSESMDWFLYDRDFCHERINAFLLVSIHRDYDYSLIMTK